MNTTEEPKKQKEEEDSAAKEKQQKLETEVGKETASRKQKQNLKKEKQNLKKGECHQAALAQTHYVFMFLYKVIFIRDNCWPDGLDWYG